MSDEPGGGHGIGDFFKTAIALKEVFVLPAAAGLWAWWRAQAARRDKQREEGMTERQQRDARDAAREAARLEGISAQEAVARSLLEGAFARQRQELIDKDADHERLLIQHAEACRDRDRGWHLARAWHRKAHDLRQEARVLYNYGRFATPQTGLTLPPAPGADMPEHLEDPP